MGTDIVSIVRTVKRWVMSIGLDSQHPTFCASMGRMLLASMPNHHGSALPDRSELRPRRPKTLIGKPKLKDEIVRVRTQSDLLPAATC